MLAQWALLALTRTEPALRRLGLAGDGVRLWARRARCSAEWAAHEAQCHAIVRRAMEGLSRRRKVLVLGSGLVRDVPIEALSRAFDEVLLVDAVHLPVTRLRLTRYRNLRFVTADLTGVARWLIGEAPSREDVLTSFHADPDIDLVISANLLSQLPLAPESWAEEHPARIPMPTAELARTIVDWHLADLARCNAHVCLLTDTRQREIDVSGRIVADDDLLHGAALPHPDEAWDWTVAPPRETGDGTALVHRVHGYADFRPSAPLAEARRVL